MRAILLATVAGVLLAGNVVVHADWRKTPLTPGNAVKDVQYDLKDLRTKRPNEPPPTQPGKLEYGIKIDHEPGSILYRVDMYPDYTAKIRLERAFTDVRVANPSIVNVLPSPVADCKDVPIGKDGGEKDESVGAGSVEPDCGPRDLIIQSYIPGNPNGQNASGGQNGNGQASGNGRNTTISGGYGNTSVPSGGSAVATGSMTNIMALNDRGEVVANLMINTMPSWQRYDEGKVEIHNGGGGGRSTGNGNLGNGGGLAAFVNYQCAPTCRRVPDPAENASSATSGTETSTTVINSR